MDSDKLTQLIHDLRQPLTVLKTYTSFLPNKVEDPEFMKEYQEKVTRALEKVEMLLKESEE